MALSLFLYNNLEIPIKSKYQNQKLQMKYQEKSGFGHVQYF